MEFRHAVSDNDRDASTYDRDYACSRTPGGEYWVYTSDPECQGVEWRDDKGEPIAVSVLVVISGVTD